MKIVNPSAIFGTHLRPKIPVMAKNDKVPSLEIPLAYMRKVIAEQKLG